MRNRKNKIWAIIPAGGVGSRMGAQAGKPKQYLPLGRKTIIEQTLQRLVAIESVDHLVVGIAKDDVHWQALNFAHQKLNHIVQAGDARVDTVENCLAYIASQGGQEDWALVHDAARPCVRIEDVNALIKAVLASQSGGLLAAPICDTIKRSSPKQAKQCVQQTVPRAGMWRAMTPQMFKVGALLAAIKAAKTLGIDISDEASAMEAVCGENEKPLLVVCASDNIKITLSQDLPLAELILQAQES